jgi:hypothetical protein
VFAVEGVVQTEAGAATVVAVDGVVETEAFVVQATGAAGEDGGRGGGILHSSGSTIMSRSICCGSAMVATTTGISRAASLVGCDSSLTGVDDGTASPAEEEDAVDEAFVLDGVKWCCKAITAAAKIPTKDSNKASRT